MGSINQLGKILFFAMAVLVALCTSCVEQAPQEKVRYLDFNVGSPANGDSIISTRYYVYLSESLNSEVVDSFLNFFICERVEATAWNKNIHLINSLRPFQGYNWVHDDIDWPGLKKATFFSATITPDSIILPMYKRTNYLNQDSIYYKKVRCTENAFFELIDNGMN